MRTTLAAVLALAAAPALAQSDPAVAPVQALDTGLLSIMKAGKGAGLAGRAALIGPVVDRTFDIPLMTRLAVGSAWNTASPADQAALTAAFHRLTVNGFAKNFDGFSGQTFTVTPQVETRGGDKLVRTTLSDQGGPVAISYRLRQGAAGWRIIDVFYKNSISQLATRRADFSGVLAQGGPRALIQHLDALAKAGG